MPLIPKSNRTLKAIDRIRQNTAAIPVWNAGDEPQTVLHVAIPRTFAVGLTEQRDDYGIPRERVVLARREKRELPEDEPKTLLVASAISIAAHAETRLGHRGIVVLTGDPETDVQLKDDARKAYLKTRATECQAVRDNYNRRVMAFTQNPNNVGKQHPPMTDGELAAEKWLNRLDAGLLTPTKKHVCPFNCGFHDDSAEEISLHKDVCRNRPTMVTPVEAAEVSDDQPESRRGRRRNAAA